MASKKPWRTVASGAGSTGRFTQEQIDAAFDALMARRSRREARAARAGSRAATTSGASAAARLFRRAADAA